MKPVVATFYECSVVAAIGGTVAELEEDPVVFGERDLTLALPPLLVDRCASGRTLVWDRAGLRRGASASSTRTATRTVSE